MATFSVTALGQDMYRNDCVRQKNGKKMQKVKMHPNNDWAQSIKKEHTDSAIPQAF